MRSSRTRNLVLLFLLVVCMFWKLVLTRQYTWLNNGDSGNLLLPWFQVQAGELHRWALTLWDPYQWCGQPLIGQGQAGTAYPFNWLLWALPLRHGWLRHVLLNWYFVLIHVQAAFFAFWLCRDLGRSVAASLFGGLLFTVGPLLGVSDWPSVLNAALWTPLLFLFFFRAERTDYTLIQQRFCAAFCGAALGMAWLSGNGEVPLLLSIVFSCLWIWLGWRNRRWSIPLWFALSALGISALQSFASAEYLAQSPASWWRYEIDAWIARSIPPMSIPAIIAPQYSTDTMCFAGCTALAFAAVGFWVECRSRQIQLLGALGMAGLLLAFGQYINLAGVLYGLRGLAREPKSGLVLFGVSVAVLSAFGLDACRRMEIASIEGMSAVAKFLAALSTLCCAALLVLVMTNGEDLKKFTPIALCAVAAILVAGLLEGWRRSALTPRAASICALLLLMWETGNVAGSTWSNIEFGWGWLSQLADTADVSQYLRSQSGPVRVETAGIPYHFGDWTGFTQVDGVSGGTEGSVHAAQYRSARALAGANFLLAKEAKPGLKKVFDSPRGLKIFELPEAAPPAFVVHRVMSVQNESQVNFLLSRPVSDLRKEAFIVGSSPQLDSCEASDQAAVLSTKSRVVTVKASLRCKGLVVLGQTWYPGWEVSVDGKPSRLLQVYSFLQGAVVPAGEHELIFTYKPRVIWAGAAVFLLSGICLLIAGIRFRQKPA